MRFATLPVASAAIATIVLLGSCSGDATPGDGAALSISSSSTSTAVPSASSSTTSATTSSLSPAVASTSTTIAIRREFASPRCSELETVSATRSGNIPTFRNLRSETRTTVNGYTASLQDIFGGQWTDRHAGTFVVAMTDDVATHQAEIDQRLGDDPPDAVEIVQVEYSKSHLDTATTDLQNEIGRWEGLKSVSTSITLNSVVAVFSDGTDDEVQEAIARLPRWVCHITSESAGPAELRRNESEELRPVVVQIDQDDVPTPQSQTLLLVLTEMDCAAGEAMGDRLRGPLVRETEATVHIEFWVAKQPAQVCRDRSQTEVVVELEQPLGDRRITTTGGATILGSKATRRSQLFLNSMVGLIDQIRTIEYVDFPLTARTATSETFPIGQAGQAKFEITGAVTQSEPAGEWRRSASESQQYSAIERATGVGVWSLCGDFYLEVISLDRNLQAAEDMFTTLSAGIGSCS